MAKIPKTLTTPDREIESAKTVDDLKKAVRLLSAELAKMHLYMRDDIIMLEDKLKNGINGWFDDGTNFRVTTTEGVVTGIADSSGGGHS